MRVLAVTFCSHEGDIDGKVGRAAELIRAFTQRKSVGLVMLLRGLARQCATFEQRLLEPRASEERP